MQANAVQGGMPLSTAGARAENLAVWPVFAMFALVAAQ
jgi:hypothetical protein